MSYGLIDTTDLTSIADAIRGKLGVQTKYKPSQMPEAIQSISGGGITPTGTKSITENGTYDVASFANAEVSVPTGITPTGTKQINITANGTVTEDITAYADAKISVNVVNQDYEDALEAFGVQSDLTDGITALTTYANSVTGESDTNLSDAVRTLADGYSASGVETVTGEVTISNSGKFPTITHNFGTKKIGLIIYPISEVVGNNGYMRFYLSYINVNDIVGGVNWPLNFTSYNSKFSGTVNADANHLRTIATQISPWTTQNSWHAASQADMEFNSGIVLTDDTIGSINGNWCNGTYRYIVYKLG